MTNNNWNNLGNDVKDIVQEALDTGNFNKLNHDLGVTIENALGNVADNLKNAAVNGRSGNVNPYSQTYNTGRRNDLRTQAARDKFALYINTRKPRTKGILATAAGFTFCGMGLFAAMILGIAGMFGLAAGAGLAIGGSVLLITSGAFGVLGGFGNRYRKMMNRFRTYVHTLNGKTYIEVADLAKAVRKPEGYVRKDLQKMIRKYMFLEGHLDDSGTCLITSNETYDQYLALKRQTEEQETIRKQEEEKEREEQERSGLSEEGKKVIAEGKEYIEQIRRSNDAIPGEEISNKMYHLENVIRRIFNRVEQHPELVGDLQKFMNYYLPTTVKLLQAYEELDRQPVEGDNIKTAKTEIENTLDTINEAFENLLDRFFKDTAWDVSTDISVLKTMLAQEGLTGKDDFQKKE